MKFTTTQKKETEVDITIPSFYKQNDQFQYGNNMIAILDEKTIADIYESELRTTVSNTESSISSVKDSLINAYLNWEVITEEEFMTAYNRALHSLSLTPELIEKSV